MAIKNMQFKLVLVAMQKVLKQFWVVLRRRKSRPQLGFEEQVPSGATFSKLHGEPPFRRGVQKGVQKVLRQFLVVEIRRRKSWLKRKRRPQLGFEEQVPSGPTFSKLHGEPPFST